MIIYLDGELKYIPIEDSIVDAMLKIPYNCLFEIVDTDITKDEIDNILKRWNECQK